MKHRVSFVRLRNSASLCGAGKCCRQCGIMFLLTICFLRPVLPVRAGEEEPCIPPHLIQTVSEQDIYEGMVGLGMLSCDVLDVEDCAAAYGNVKDCIVRIGMGNAYGSGVIWELKPDCVIIATNAHVLAYWKDLESYVYFPQGYFTDASVLGISGKYDVGFLKVSNDRFTYEQLKRLRYVCAEEAVCTAMEEGDGIFVAGAGEEADSIEFYEGTIADQYRYIEFFEEPMLYGYGFAKEGMSGGGIFDNRGYFIGMLAGGTRFNEIAGVPYGDIKEAYEEIMGRQAYGAGESNQVSGQGK